MSDKPNENVVNFDEIVERELDEIVTRRRQAKLAPVVNGESARTQVAKDLVGVALSGGGVRSASFSIGLIQALYQKGILRFVDYISTVSGGGYAGSCLSSLALHPETKFKWNVEECDGQDATRELNGHANSDTHQKTDIESEENFPLAPMPDGRQPKRVVELIHGGNSLRRPLLFFNRYLIGVVLTNIVLMSALFTIAAMTAYLFRCLDFRGAIDFLYALGFRGDIWRAFFPSYVLLIVWLLMWAVSYWRKGSQATGKYARWFMTLTFVSVLFAFAALLGTGDISLTYWKNELGIATPEEELHTYGRELKIAFVLLLLVALLPYLRLKDLIRSGTKPRNAVEGWVFAIASRALLFGLPLVVFAWFAHENISHHNEKRLETKHGVTVSRLHDLVPLEIKDWDKTWRAIELEASIHRQNQPRGAVDENEENVQDPNEDLFRVSGEVWTALNSAPDEMGKLRDALRISSEISRSDRQSTQRDRWLQMFAWFITGEQNDFSDQFERRKQLVQLKQNICDYLTVALIRNPVFFKNFENIENDFPEMSADARKRLQGKIKALTLRGQGIQTQNAELIKNSADKIGLDDWLKQRETLLVELTTLEEAGDKDGYETARKRLDEWMVLANGQYAKLADELQNVNWNLLKTYYGDQLVDKDTVFAMVVVKKDQATRLRWAGWSALFFLLSSLVVSLNATSLHGFYRNRLSQTWVTECPAFGRNIPLARLDTTTKGAPYHLIGASLHLLGRNVDGQPPLVPFLFSRAFCGSDRTGYVATAEYAGGRYDLPNAMSISGAAVTPTQVHNPLLAALLLVANSRLGQWLPNPAHRRLVPWWMEGILSRLPPSPLRLCIGWLQKPEARNYAFVADGGHTENLGLLELLRRRCKLIIVSDASHDPEYHFQNYVDLHRKVRSELGIHLQGIDGGNIELQRATPDVETGLASEHFVFARIIYPATNGSGEQVGASEGLLVLVKPNFTGDEPIDLQSYRDHEPLFPNHPTTDQFYDPDRFESYRQLGFHIGTKVCDELIRDMRRSDGPGNPLADNKLFGGALESASDDQVSTEELPDKLSPENLRVVLKALKSGNDERRQQAVHLIGENAPQDKKSQRNVIDCLYQTLAECNGNRVLREKVMWALGELHVNEAEIQDRLISVVCDDNAQLKARIDSLETFKNLYSNGDKYRRTLKRLAKIDNDEIARHVNSLLAMSKPTQPPKRKRQ